MEKTGVQRLASVLKVLVTITFICNLAALPVVPVLVMIGREGLGLLGLFSSDPGLGGFLLLARAGEVNEYGYVLSVFLVFCGGCTAVILWQGRRVLNTILAGDPFAMPNARNLRRAAVCCFLIAAAALVRTVWGFGYYASLRPLFTYNALFCPVFLMGGLLCLVMSALFRQAAELKAENDLTI